VVADLDLIESARKILGRDCATQDFLFANHLLGEVLIEVRTDDPLLLAEIATTLGPSVSEVSNYRTRLGATIVTKSGEDHGVIRFEADDPAMLTPDDLLFALQSPAFPFRRVDEGSEWVVFAYLDDVEPLFYFRGDQCVFRFREHWRAGIAFLLLHRIYRMRKDAIFFHAATVDVFGKGVMLVGMKGAGKSTTALALAARGRTLLGDEIACYVPKSQMLVPFRRPVGIKPGPRSRAVHEALVATGLEPGESIARIDVQRFMEAGEPTPVPLSAIVFLDPFEAEPRIERSSASLADVGALQPAAGSLVNAPAGLRTMQMAQMLASAKVYRFAPGDPDESAAFLERALGDES
jgi:hypothetical protein